MHKFVLGVYRNMDLLTQKSEKRKKTLIGIIFINGVREFV